MNWLGALWFKVLPALRTRWFRTALLGLAFLSQSMFLPVFSDRYLALAFLGSTFLTSVILLAALAPTPREMVQDFLLATSPLPMAVVALLCSLSLVALAQRFGVADGLLLSEDIQGITSLCERLFSTWTMAALLVGWPILGIAFTLKATGRLDARRAAL